MNVEETGSITAIQIALAGAFSFELGCAAALVQGSRPDGVRADATALSLTAGRTAGQREARAFCFFPILLCAPAGEGCKPALLVSLTHRGDAGR